MTEGGARRLRRLDRCFSTNSGETVTERSEKTSTDLGGMPLILYVANFLSIHESALIAHPAESRHQVERFQIEHGLRLEVVPQAYVVARDAKNIAYTQNGPLRKPLGQRIGHTRAV